MIGQHEGISPIAVQSSSYDKATVALHSFHAQGIKPHQQTVHIQQSIPFDGGEQKSQSSKNERINAENGDLPEEIVVINPFRQASAQRETVEQIIPDEQSSKKKENKQDQNYNNEQNLLIATNQEKIFESKQSESKLEQALETPSVMESNKTIESKFLSEKKVNNEERNPSNLQITLKQANHNPMKKESNLNNDESASLEVHQEAQHNLLAKSNQEQPQQRQGYRLNSQFVESIQEQKEKKIVDFDEFPQSQRIKQTSNIPQIQNHQKTSRQQEEKVAKNTEEFSFAQKQYHQPVQKDVFNDSSPSKRKQESPKQGVGKIAKKVLHQKKIHDVIVNLQRNDPKKIVIPRLQQAKKRGGQPDLSKLSTHITLNSNIISLTIGQLISKEDNQAVRLLQEIEYLKRKLSSIEGSIKRKDQLNQQQNAYKQAKFESLQEQALANKHNGRQNLGQIYRRIEFNNSKLSQQLQSAGLTGGKRLRLNQSQTVRSAPKPRFSPFSDAFQNSIGNIDPNESEKRGETNQFRVRKNKIALLGQQTHKQAGFIRHQKKSSEKDKCFQTRKEALQKLQFTQDEKMNLIQKPKPREFTFNEDFGQYVDKYFFDIGNEVPMKDWNQQDLVQIAKVTYKKFGVNLQNQKQTLHVKKYKNCVSFILDSIRTIIWYYEGKFYYGGWEIKDSGDGEKNGWGYQYTPQKFQYSGFFKDNKREGYGIMRFLTQQNDLVYQGYWKNGMKNGQGKQKQADRSVYIGQWQAGKRGGKGKLVASDKQVYEGSFLNGLKNGEGRETFASGDSYEGHYKQGKFHGFGVYTWANFSRYEGQFRQGSRNGQGIWVSDYRDKNSEHYEGQYKDDKKNGFGLYCWKDGTKYQGQFLNDLKHGEGVVSYPDGKSARLQWFEGNIIPQQATIQSQQASTKNNEQGLKADQSKKSAPKPSLAKFNIKNSSRPKVANQR